MSYETTVRGPDGKNYTFEVHLGDCLGDAVSMFGPETVYLLFTQKAKDSANREAKRLLKKHPPNRVLELMRDWKPDSKAAKKNAANAARAKEALSRLSAEAQKEVMREQARLIDGEA